MKKMKLVMVGNGMAGVRAVEELIKLAPDLYDITVFGAEPHPNYNRILLSPVLAGEQTIDEIILNPWEWYSDNGITLHAGRKVVEVDRVKRIVRADDGTEAPYDRLLLCTGSNPFILPVPGKDLPGVIAYRDIADTERMIDVVMKDLSAAFEPLSPVTFQFDRIETNPRFASIARPTNAAVNVRFRVDMEDRGGRLELLIPYATLEPIRELLLQRFMGEKFGRDSIWENHLATELYRTHLDVEAVLGQQDMTLADVMKFKSGQTILFGTHARQPIELRCGGVTLGYGRMGRSGGAVAVQLTERKPAQPAAQFRAKDGEMA